MEEPSKRKQHIILVHGACHGAWAWFKVATLLKSAGHRVTVPDLAASGIDPRRIEEVASFADYSQSLLEIMASLPVQEKVILVGHSLGGLNIAMTGDVPGESSCRGLHHVVHAGLCLAFEHILLQPLQHSPQSMWMDTQFSPVEAHEQKPLTLMVFGPQFMASKLYQLCSPEDLMLATTLVRPSSLFAKDLENMPAFSKDRYGSVPRFYVVCSDDAVIVKDFQQWMIQNYPVNKVFEIEGADHTAMLSKPQELCQYLLHIADDVKE